MGDCLKRGEKMAEETIAKILGAEAEADALEQEAIQAAGEIVRETDEAIKGLRASVNQRIAKYEEECREKAEKTAQAQEEKWLRDIEEEFFKEEEAAKERMPQAAEALFAYLTKGKKV